MCMLHGFLLQSKTCVTGAYKGEHAAHACISGRLCEKASHRDESFCCSRALIATTSTFPGGCLKVSVHELENCSWVSIVKRLVCVTRLMQCCDINQGWFDRNHALDETSGHTAIWYDIAAISILTSLFLYFIPSSRCIQVCENGVHPTWSCKSVSIYPVTSLSVYVLIC